MFSPRVLLSACLVSALSVLTSCSSSSNRDGAGPPGSEKPGEVVLKNDMLIVSTDMRNEFSASGLTKAEILVGNFDYRPATTMRLHLWGYTNTKQNCAPGSATDFELVVVPVDASGTALTASAFKLSEEKDLQADTNYRIQLRYDNSGRCSSVNFAFGVQAKPATSQSSDGTVDPPAGRVPPVTPVVDPAAASLDANVIFYGKLSEREGCQESFAWRLGDQIRTSRPGRPDETPFVKMKVEVIGSLDPELRIVQINFGYEMNLIEISLPADELKQVQSAFHDGQTIRLTEDAACLGDGMAEFRIRNSYDLYLFNGNPETGDTTNHELTMSRERPEDFGVKWQYDRSGFFWELRYRTTLEDRDLQNIPETLRWSIFNRKARAYVTEWKEIPRSALEQATLRVDDPATLHRILPHQRELVVIFDYPSALSGLPNPRHVIEYQTIFTSYIDQYFTDLTNAGRSRFELRAADLPLVP